jgi:hypothetical protein
MVTVYRFKIADSWSPATLPMQRLAEYMAEFAKLLGQSEHVHFEAIEASSAVLAAKVDEPARPNVQERIGSLRAGTAPEDVRKAARRLDDFLAADNARGALYGDNDNVILIPFAGKDRPKPIVFGPFREEGSLEGQIVSIGGEDETIHVHLRDGDIVHTKLVATIEIARKLAPYFLGPIIRVHGTGTWVRHGDGVWELRSFRIVTFDPLDETPLTKVVEKLRAVKGNEWDSVPDPVKFLLSERHGEGDVH